MCGLLSWEEKKHEVELQLRLKLIDTLMERIHKTIEDLIDYLSGEPDYRGIALFDEHLFNHYKTSVLAIPFMEIPYAKLAKPIVDLPQAMDDLVECFRRARKQAVAQDDVMFGDYLFADDIEDKAAWVNSLVLKARAMSLDLEVV